MNNALPVDVGTAPLRDDGELDQAGTMTDVVLCVCVVLMGTEVLVMLPSCVVSVIVPVSMLVLPGF